MEPLLSPFSWRFQSDAAEKNNVLLFWPAKIETLESNNHNYSKKHKRFTDPLSGILITKSKTDMLWQNAYFLDLRAWGPPEIGTEKKKPNKTVFCELARIRHVEVNSLLKENIDNEVKYTFPTVKKRRVDETQEIT